MKSFLIERMRVPNTPELELRMQVLTETVERLISFAYEQRTSEARGLVLQEMKRMLTDIYSCAGKTPGGVGLQAGSRQAVIVMTSLPRN